MLSMAAQMVFLNLESMMVVHQGENSATEPEWRAFITELAGQDLRKLRVLILTNGGGLTAEQRAELKATMAGRSVRTAVVSDSMKVRFIVATIALINREHHCFTRAEIGKAYDFLELTATERTETARAILETGRLLA